MKMAEELGVALQAIAVGSSWRSTARVYTTASIPYSDKKNGIALMVGPGTSRGLRSVVLHLNLMLKPGSLLSNSFTHATPMSGVGTVEYLYCGHLRNLVKCPV